jgi:peptidyl-prolyl cis-trans isomerase C
VFYRVLRMMAVLAVIALAGCGTPNPSPVPSGTGTAEVPDPHVTTAGTPVPSAPTAESLAAQVNGQPITLGAFQRAVARCVAAEMALGHDATQASCEARTLDELIERVLIQGEAQKLGLGVTDDEVNAQVGQMKSESGDAKFDQWLRDNQYADESELREDLRAQILGGKIFQQITGSVPATAEQVHARHILVATEADAQNLLALLQGGADFEQLAAQYSLDESTRATGGDLGFFYRGLLTVPEVETAAFSMQPGETSGVIQSTRGYHIVQTVERDPQHPLNPEDLQRIRQQAFERWLAELWSQARIEKYVALPAATPT